MILVFFYIFSFLSIFLRFLNTLTNWCSVAILAYVVEDVYMVAKLCVGLIQAWTTLEMILRISQIFKSNGSQHSYNRYEKWIKFGQYFVIVFSVLILIAYTIQDTIRSTKPHPEEWYVYKFYTGFACAYLFMFTLTLVINLLLFKEIQASKSATDGMGSFSF